MKEILFDFSRVRARNAQHVQFATDVVASISQEVAKSRGFASQYATFTKAVADEQECFQPNKGYLETSEIVAVDMARDRLFYFYKQVIQAYADYHPDDAKQKAGATLAFVFREAGKVADADYASETALLTDLVGRLRQAPNVAALTAIGLESAPDDLEAANEAFNAIYLKRAAEERDRAQAWKMKDLRRVTDDAYNELAKAVNALFAVNELVTKDEETRTALTAVIDDVNAIAIRLKKTIGQGTSGLKPGDSGTGGDGDGESPDPILPGDGDGDGESPDPIV